MAEATHRVPPRHCTKCGVRIWSLNSVYVKSSYNARLWQDLCVDCDTGNPSESLAWLPIRRAAR